MARIGGSFVTGAAGNVLFWFINEQVALLAGPAQYWTMAALFGVLFAIAYFLLREPEAARPSTLLASDLDSDGGLSADVSGAKVHSGGAVVASRNKSVGDMTIVAKDVDLN